MRTGIHPNYKQVQVSCSCGDTWTTGSTNAEIKLDICSSCHPFYTGTQRIVDTGGQVERFMKRYFLVAKDVGDLTAIVCSALQTRHTKKQPILQRMLDSLKRLALGRTVILASHSATAHTYGGRRLNIAAGRVA